MSKEASRDWNEDYTRVEQPLRKASFRFGLATRQYVESVSPAHKLLLSGVPKRHANRVEKRNGEQARPRIRVFRGERRPVRNTSWSSGTGSRIVRRKLGPPSLFPTLAPRCSVAPSHPRVLTATETHALSFSVTAFSV